MSKLFPVQEIGSLAKPKWRTKGLRQQLSSQDLSEAEEWAAKLGIQDFHDRAKSILKTANEKERVKAILELSTLYGLRRFETSGVDNDGVGGEQQRVEMYEHVIKAVQGMNLLGHVHSFDNKYFNKGVAESKISRKHPIYVPEFLDVKKYADLTIVDGARDVLFELFGCNFNHDYSVTMSPRRHKYQVPALRYGRHDSAMRTMSSGFGGSCRRYAAIIELRTPRSPTGRMRARGR